MRELTAVWGKYTARLAPGGPRINGSSSRACEMGGLICSDGKSESLNKLSKAMRDSPRRVFLNSTTQDRTPWDDLSRLVAALILDRVSGTLRSACLMSLIARIVFVFAMSDSHDED